MAIQGQGSGWRLWKPSSVAVRTSHAGDSIVCNRSDHNVVDPIRNHMSNLTIQRSYNLLLYILSKYYKYLCFSVGLSWFINVLSTTSHSYGIVSHKISALDSGQTKRPWSHWLTINDPPGDEIPV